MGGASERSKWLEGESVPIQGWVCIGYQRAFLYGNVVLLGSMDTNSQFDDGYFNLLSNNGF